MCKIFVALNFRGLDEQRKFFYVLPVLCVKKWRLTNELAAFEAITLLPRHCRKRIDLSDNAPPGCTSCTARFLVTCCHVRHYAICHGYSWRRNDKRERSLGVRRPISLLKVSKKSHRHSLLAHHVSKLDDRKVI